MGATFAAPQHGGGLGKNRMPGEACHRGLALHRDDGARNDDGDSLAGSWIEDGHGPGSGVRETRNTLRVCCSTRRLQSRSSVADAISRSIWGFCANSAFGAERSVRGRPSLPPHHGAVRPAIERPRLERGHVLGALHCHRRVGRGAVTGAHRGGLRLAVLLRPAGPRHPSPRPGPGADPAMRHHHEAEADTPWAACSSAPRRP